MRNALPFCFAMVLCGAVWAQDLAAEARGRGLAARKPVSGPAVQISSDRWMVPYHETIADGLTFLMVPIPGGTTTVGSPSDESGRRPDEGPQARVTLKPYWMAAKEVSWNEYKMFESLDRKFRGENRNISRRKPLSDVDAIAAPTPLYDVEFAHEYGNDSFPAVSMSHFGAMQYTKWLTLTTKNQYRLPTEVEWEHACRAGTATRYSFGNDDVQLPKYVRFDQFDDDTVEGPLPVGSLEPNPWGLHDMHGNVAEWVIDQYASNAWEELPRRLNAPGPVAMFGNDVYPRVYKGGSWMDSADFVRSAVRFGSSDELNEYDPELPQSAHWMASDAARGIGFRVVRSLEPESPEIIARFWNPVPQLAKDLETRISEGRNTMGVVPVKE